MQTRRRNTFTTIRTEGAILPPDLLLRISEGDKDLKGFLPTDYHLLLNEKLNEAINRSWNRLFGAWESFQTAQEKVLAGQAGTTETRERWLLPLFQELGFGRLQTSTALTLNGKSYPISHVWGRAPIHLLGFNVAIDKRTPGVAGAAHTSPHSMLQEFLNRSDDHLWGFLSNGLILRILRDNVSLTRQAYVEFDLQGMMEGEVYADFVLLWMLCHQSRVEGEKPEEFWLEQWSRKAQEQGTRALDQLRDGVEDAISALGTGFLVHPANQALRDKLRDSSLNTQNYYRQLLRLVYRLIFLFVAEDRDLLFPPDSDLTARKQYTEYYSTQRLRRLAERSRGSRHADLYHTLRLVTDKLGSIEGCAELALPALGGFLFSDDATPDLNQAELPNNNLLDAVRALAYTIDNRTLRPVDYKNLGPEELGSVYESLLELHPEMNVDAGAFTLTSASGHERKTTGSYYTPSSLIQVLLDSALDPVIEDRLRAVKSKTTEEQEQALLNIKVCDPASGSGHFLIAAAHRIAKVLAALRTGDDEPSPESTSTALRDVISNCIYGVDVNPMAVELCKVSLWMEALEPGKPLSFLDAHIKCGNSLVGVGPGMDISEIPDEAFQPAFGDDKVTAAALRNRNNREREGQLGFRWDVNLIKDHEDLAQWVARKSQQLEIMPEDQAGHIREKEAAYKAIITTESCQRQRLEYDMWTAAFFWPITKTNAEDILAPTQREMNHLHKGEDLHIDLAHRIKDIAVKQRFFHWKFEFPTVFGEDIPGFDVVIGNPPWDMLQFNPKEYFMVKAPGIANITKAATRESMIKQLATTNPKLFSQYKKERHYIDSANNFVKKSQRFPLTSFGRINLMALFAETARICLSESGRFGLIVPTGIATDSYNQYFFSELIKSGSIYCLYDFINKDPLFPQLDRTYKFCILTVSNKAVMEAKYAFFLGNPSELNDENKVFNLSAREIELINPNTKTLPIFRTRADAEITRKIYSRMPILVNEETGESSWDFKGLMMFYMNTDSSLFHEGKRAGYLPLYESKYFHQYNHRWAENRSGKTKELSSEQKNDPTLSITPRYWVDKKKVVDKVIDFYGKDVKYHLVQRAIANVTSEKRLIFSVIPSSGIGNSAIAHHIDASIWEICCYIALFNSVVLDYLIRIKAQNPNINRFVIKQLPFINKTSLGKNDIAFITPRVLELTYSAWDLEPFAQELGYGGPPFSWNENRRAILRAELDAYCARLYGLDHNELRYILEPEDVYGPDFPGETFRVLKEKEIKKFGEYRTRNLVLAAWDRMQESIDNGTEYVPMVDPPPAHPSVAHPNRDGSVYEGPGLVLDKETAIETKPIPSQPEVDKIATREEETISAEPKVEKTVTGLKSTQTSDYSLYKCKGCGQMVMGFDKENHVKTMHGGEEQEFAKL